MSDTNKLPAPQTIESGVNASSSIDWSNDETLAAVASLARAVANYSQVCDWSTRVAERVTQQIKAREMQC